MKEKLLRKGHRFVSRYMEQCGYVVACSYEEGENMIVEFSRVHAGVTLESVTVVFNGKWRVIEVR